MAGDPYREPFYVGEALARRAAEFPAKPALFWRNEQLTFAEVDRRATALACHLQNTGVRKSDRVGLFLPNSIAFALAYYATQRAGATTVVFDSRLRGRELERVLADSQLSLLIAHRDLYSEVEKARAGELPAWLVQGEGERSFERRLEPAARELSQPKLAPDDDAVILYTSGTTGEPKGVVLSYVNLAQFPRCMEEVYGLDANTVWGCILPMSHISGPIYLNAIAAHGSSMVIFDQFNPLSWLEGIEKHGITIFHGVPTVFQLLLGTPSFSNYDTRSVKLVAMMGTTVPVSLMRAFKAAVPHATVVQGYGLTETSPMVTITDAARADEKMASIGKAVPAVEIRLVDDGGNDVPEGEPGEIITRGPHVMKGYFRNPAATAEQIRDGWLYTGDIGRRDREGYYYHLGRKDDMIITGGLNVYPAEVENLLCEHPDVQEAVAFALPDEKRGNALAAAVVPRPGREIEEKALLAYLRRNLASFKVPQRIIVRESLPRTSSGKVIRDAQAIIG